MANTGNLLQGILAVLLLLSLTSLGMVYFNDTYGKDYDLGLDTGALDDIESTIGASKNLTVGGEVEQTDGGLSLVSSWAIGKSIFSLLWDFANGTWITNLMMNVFGLGTAGAIISTVLRLMFLSFLIFSVIKLFFKIAF